MRADPSADATPAAAGSLASFLEQERISLVAAPQGEGLPVVHVADYGACFAWADPLRSGGGRSGYHPVAGTFADRIMQRDGAAARSPYDQAQVAPPAISLPDASTDVQYVARLGIASLSGGDFYIANADPAGQVGVMDRLQALGLQPVSVRHDSLREAIGKDMFFQLTVAMAMGGAAGMAIWHRYVLRARLRRFGTYARCGARPVRYAIRATAAQLPAALTGASVAAATIVCALSWARGAPLSLEAGGLGHRLVPGGRPGSHWPG